MKILTKLSALLCLFFLTKSHELDKLNYDIKKLTSKRDGTSSSQLTSEEKSKKDYGFIENWMAFPFMQNWIDNNYIFSFLTPIKF